MTLSISDTILDEEFRTPATGSNTENDTTAAAFAASGVAAPIAALSLTTVSGYTGFPQYAEKTSFFSSTNQITELFLTSSATGTPFPAAGVATTLAVGGDTVFLFGTSDPNIVVGRVGSGAVADPTGETALIIALEETKAGGLVTGADLWLALYAPLVQDGADQVDTADTLDLANLIYLGSDYNTSTEVPFENFAGVPSGQDAFALVGPTSGSSPVDLLITGFKGSTVSTVNVSTQGLGSGAQHTDETESLRIDIVDANAADFAKADTASEVHDAKNISYAGGHVDAIGATFEIEQINPTGNVATVTVLAFNTDTDVQGTTFPTMAISSPGTAVQIDVEDVLVLNAANQDITAAFLSRGGTIVASGNGVEVNGILVHEQVKFATDGAVFNRFTVTNTDNTKGNDTWDLGAIKIATLVGGSNTEYAELGSHLLFEDDGPVIAPSNTAAPILTVSDILLGELGNDSESFAGLFDADDYGADGAGTLTYDVGTPTSGVNSGLVDTVTGNSVFLFLEDNTDTPYVGDHKVVGREGTDAAAAATGALVFFIAADPDTGTVTLQQERAVFHAKNTNDTSVSFATAELVTLTATISDSETNADTASASVDIGLSFNIEDDVPVIDETSGEDLFVDNTVPDDSDSGDFDVDGGNDTPAKMSIVGAPDSGGFTFAFDDADHDSITGKYNGEDLYTLLVDDDGGYLFTLIGDLPSSVLNLNTAEIKAGGPDTNFIDVGALETDDFVRISGDSTAGAGNINESHAFVGVDNGNLDVGESLEFTLHKANGDPIHFQGISIGTKSAQASQYHWVADLVGGGTASGDVTVPKNGVILVDPAGDVLVESVTITKVTGSATKIGLGDIDILLPPGDFELGFDLQLTDEDDDFDVASFVVQIDGNGDGTIDDPIVPAANLTLANLGSGWM